MKREAEPTSPGRAFELEVAQLLRSGGYRLEPNAPRTPPQTDIYAHGPDVELLVHVSERKREIDAADIRALRARLRRTASDIVGVIFTTASVTTKALKEIEIDRVREIIVFLNEEIELLKNGRAHLFNLIERKRRELRSHGRAWFHNNAAEYLHVPLPSSSIRFDDGNTTASYFLSRTGFAHSSYALSFPDSGCENPDGQGVRLLLQLALSSCHDLRSILGYIHDRFGLSTHGAFSIHQDGTCWHGVGVQNFLGAVMEWRPRYAAAPLSRVHQSEDVVYFDKFRDGWLSLYTRQRIPFDDEPDSTSYLHSSELCIHLPGMPVDTAPFISLCRHIGDEWAEFTYIHPHRTHTRHLKTPIKLQIVGTAVSANEESPGDKWIVGVVARNPFYKRKRLPRELRIEDVPLQDLLQTELLLCDLNDPIPVGNIVDAHFLMGIETTQAHNAQVIRPFGTWRKIARRAKDDTHPLRDVEPDLRAVCGPDKREGV